MTGGRIHPRNAFPIGPPEVLSEMRANINAPESGGLRFGAIWHVSGAINKEASDGRQCVIGDNNVSHLRRDIMELTKAPALDNV